MTIYNRRKGALADSNFHIKNYIITLGDKFFHQDHLWNQEFYTSSLYVI